MAKDDSDAFQHNFAAGSSAMFERATRQKKAAKVIAVLADHLGRLDQTTLLDFGASTGIMATEFGRHCRTVVGVDIDRDALEYARSHNRHPNVEFRQIDGLDLPHGDGSFDVVVCNQVYEHVPDARKLMLEIARVLRPGGVCYLSATNRLKVMEHHYGPLPFLSIIPKPLAHFYLRLLRRADRYYETHLTVWGLRRIVAEFDVIDYTRRIVAEPDRFEAEDMIRSGSMKQRIALFVIRWCYWATPGYVWLLIKPTRN